MRTLSIRTALCACIILLTSACTHTQSLLDEDLSKFEIWLGVPHVDSEGLPEGTYQSKNVKKGTPIGLGQNLKDIFTTIEEDGEVVLKVSGEIFGALTTLEKYSDYHLSVFFKWGDKKWPPRATVKRDSGILYHCYGEHGRFWEVWKTCLEYQVQETDLGDYIPLAGNTAKPQKVPGPTSYVRGQDKRYDPESDNYFLARGYIHAASEHDVPHGEWNHLEIYVLGNDAVHLVNGHIVMVVEDAAKPDGTPLTQGQIQLQSEAAECYFKKLELTSISKFPTFIEEQVRFRE
ncbi:MAG: 3-keto-disaccharide hydrolase [Opitutales bacterium]